MNRKDYIIPILLDSINVDTGKRIPFEHTDYKSYSNSVHKIDVPCEEVRPAVAYQRSEVTCHT